MTCERHGEGAMGRMDHCRACDLDNVLQSERADQISNYDRGFRDGRAAAMREMLGGMYGEFTPITIRATAQQEDE